MTSEEMTTGSVGATEGERKWAAARTRWWNSTGGGTSTRTVPGVSATTKGIGAVKAGDGGVKFRAEWPDLDEENWKWMKENRIDAATGNVVPDPDAPHPNGCSPETASLRRRPMGSAAGLGAVVEGGQAAREVRQSWIQRHKLMVGAVALFSYVILARLLGERSTSP